jgi:hypothetical protein
LKKTLMVSEFHPNVDKKYLINHATSFLHTP